MHKFVVAYIVGDSSPARTVRLTEAMISQSNKPSAFSVCIDCTYFGCSVVSYMAHHTAYCMICTVLYVHLTFLKFKTILS